MTVRRATTYAVNTLLVVAIVLIIGATWLPAIYVSPRFQNNLWVRTHLLGRPTPAGAQKDDAPPKVPTPAGRSR